MKRLATLLILALSPAAMGQVIIPIKADTSIVIPAGSTITTTPSGLIINFGGPVPPTPTPPNPTPTPTVPVLTGDVWALLVYETDAVPAVATTQTVTTAASSNAITLVAAKATDPSGAAWVPVAKAKGINPPAVLFVQRTTTGAEAKHVVALPTSDADLATLFNKIRGK